MNALFLKDLAEKTRRGLRGRVEAGKSGGGNSYGYDVVKHVAPNGEPIRGDRALNECEAVVIKRIFQDYAAGKSAKRIAKELNEDQIPAPGGGQWGFSTINGNPKRANGILNNEIYIGRLVWNRQRFLKDPDTGRRISRLNPPEEWTIKEVPVLRIVDDQLWQAVKARQRSVKVAHAIGGKASINQIHERRRPRYLLSGLTKCGCCGAGFTLISAHHVGCATARNKGTCSNRLSVRRERLEARVLNALSSRLMDPQLFAEFCEEFTREMNRARMEASGTFEAARRELGRIKVQIKKLIEAIKNGVPPLSVKDELIELEARKAELLAALSSTVEPPALLHPNMAGYYRQQVSELHQPGDYRQPKF